MKVESYGTATAHITFLKIEKPKIGRAYVEFVVDDKTFRLNVGDTFTIQLEASART
jgi:hypothetical protein